MIYAFLGDKLHRYRHINQVIRLKLHHQQTKHIIIHDALNKLITCGETAFNVQSSGVKVGRMSRAIPGINKTGSQEQFDAHTYVCI